MPCVKVSQHNRKTNYNSASKHASYSGTPEKGHSSLEKCLIPGLKPGVSEVSLPHLTATDVKGLQQTHICTIVGAQQREAKGE